MYIKGYEKLIPDLKFFWVSSDDLTDEKQGASCNNRLNVQVQNYQTRGSHLSQMELKDKHMELGSGFANYTTW